MPTITSVVRDPGGNAVEGATVFVTLYAGRNLPGFLPDGTVIGTRRITTDESGTWTAELRPNADFLPTNTHYKVVEALPDGRRYTYAIIVPDGDGTYSARDLLATTPPEPDPLVPIGDGSGGVVSVDGRTGVVTLSDRYAPLSHSHSGVYAPASHNHDSAYAATGHTHSGYASASHDHNSSYATLGHEHEGYAEAVHSHAEYAAVGHNHNSNYAVIGHEHPYADEAHDHDADYSAVGHTHSEYASTSHNHDSAYAALSHDHGATVVAYTWNGTAYVPAPGAAIYTGPTDPGAVPDGSAWMETP